MTLDDVKPIKLICQLRFGDCFALWDRAGRVASRMARTWPGLKTTEGQPHQQTLRAPGVELQTAFTSATVTLSGEAAGDHSWPRLKETFQTWRDELELVSAQRVSTRAIYAKRFASVADANAALFDLKLVRRPESKVFDQPQEAEMNSVDVAYRFEDAASFVILRLRTERITYSVELDRDFVDTPDISATKNLLLVDFDRGLLGEVPLTSFNMEDWLKGCKHLLRRDLAKVIGTAR